MKYLKFPGSIVAEHFKLGRTKCCLKGQVG